MKKKCILCGKGNKTLNSLKVISNTIRERKNTKVYFCKIHELGFLPDTKKLNYKSQYGSKLLKIKNFKTLSSIRLKDLKETVKRFKNIYNFKKKTVLEIGPGVSPIFSYLRKEVNLFYVKEENIKYVEYLKKKYKEINFPNFSENQMLNNKFDCIIMIHVFEHIEDPIYFLKDVKKLLKKGGSMLIIVPNLNDIYSSELSDDVKKNYKKFMFHTAHKFYYTMKSLKTLFQKSNLFKVKYISTFQEYSITNFFYWHFFKKPNSSYSRAISSSLKSDELNKMFVKFCEDKKKGSPLILRAEKL